MQGVLQTATSKYPTHHHKQTQLENTQCTVHVGGLALSLDGTGSIPTDEKHD